MRPTLISERYTNTVRVPPERLPPRIRAHLIPPLFEHLPPSHASRPPCPLRPNSRLTHLLRCSLELVGQLS
eukprot:6196909-Pleurochrysis_carterae.AAC.2